MKILIIIPAYNEEGNIAKTIEDIFRLYPSARESNFNSEPGRNVSVLVVDDGSKDNTRKVALHAGAQVVSLPFNLGIGGAVQTGFKFAREKDFDVAIQVDGDNQHDVSFLEKLIDPIEKGQVDMTIGSRFIPPYLGFQSSFIRRIGINFFARLISFLTATKVTDPTSGFRAFNKKLIKVFADYYPIDFPEPEAIVVARRYGANIVEVPVQMRKRVAGSSSIRYLKTLYYMIKVTFAILLDKLKHGGK